MSKNFLTIITFTLFATGFVWFSLVLALLIAFRYAAYMLPFIVLTCCLWIYDVHVYVYAAYAVLAAILIVFVYTRSYFRFSV